MSETIAGPLQTPVGQVHRTKADWDQLAQQLGYKDMVDLLNTLYHKQKMSATGVAMALQKHGLAITGHRVRQLMRRLKLKRRPASAPHYPPVYWRGVDWRKTNQQIADDKGIDPSTVRRWRERLSQKASK